MVWMFRIFFGILGIFGTFGLAWCWFLEHLEFLNSKSQMISCVLECLEYVDFLHFLDLRPCKMCLKPPRKVGHWGVWMVTIYMYTYICRPMSKKVLGFLSWGCSIAGMKRTSFKNSGGRLLCPSCVQPALSFHSIV